VDNPATPTHWSLKAIGAVALVVGAILDFYLNVITMSIVCLEVPKEWVVTKRLKRYHKLAPSHGWRQWWRYHVAHFICTNWLNPFDKSGTHC
jgi:hypothetical protein